MIMQNHHQASGTLLNIQEIYEELRPVYDGLSFFIPGPSRRSRTVRLGDVWFELWSPNTSKMEFYPGWGTEESAYSASHLTNPTFPDGRIGPYDWTLHPQHFCTRAPWLGFVRCPPTNVGDWRTISAELVPLVLVWLSSKAPRRTGTIDSNYARCLSARANQLSYRVMSYGQSEATDQDLRRVLDSRPTYPSPSDTNRLLERREWRWEELVPLFTAIQRGLREMEAWLTMMMFWDLRHNLDGLKFIPEAGLERVGVWLNGASKSDGLWLLRIGVIPVYVIHRYVPGEDYPSPTKPEALERRPKYPFPDFVAGTPAELLNLPEQNHYLSVLLPIATMERSQCLSTGNSPSLVLCPTKDSLRSSSWAARGRERLYRSAIIFAYDSGDDTLPMALSNQSKVQSKVGVHPVQAAQSIVRPNEPNIPVPISRPREGSASRHLHGQPASISSHRGHGHGQRHLHASTSRSNAISSALSVTIQASDLNTKRHRQHGGNRRAGCREALTDRFRKPFWDIVDTISTNTLATCTPEQQRYIATKSADRAAKASAANVGPDNYQTF